MKKYKNTELAKQYKVSEKTIRNWIENGKKRQVNLEIINDGKREYIADTPTNHLVMKDLSQKGRKFKNKLQKVVVSPDQDFYDLFNTEQVIDIVKNIENNREIPHKYTYFNGGAESWDKYVKGVMSSGAPITANKTKLALQQDKDYIYNLVKDSDGVNIVDIGPGNGMPIKEFVSFLIKEKLLRKYIAIDYSPQILKIVQKNMRDWFGDSIEIECFQKDITQDNIQEILFMNSSDRVPNIVLFIGTTIENQMHYDHTLANVKVGLGSNDYFFLGQLLDTEKSNSYLEFYNEEKVNDIDDIDLELMVPNLLNLNLSHYNVKRYYNLETKSSIICLKFKLDIEINYKFQNMERKVFLGKDEELVIYRHNHHTLFEVTSKLYNLGFSILHINTSSDLDHMMSISKIKTKSF